MIIKNEYYFIEFELRQYGLLVCYHRYFISYVYNKLKRATKGIDHQKSQDQYQKAVKSTLKEIASEAQEVGSKVNKWLTKT